MKKIKNFRKQILSDKRQRIFLFALFSLALNIAYAIYNIYLGISLKSYWSITMSVYYILLGTMRFNAVYIGAKIKKLPTKNRKSIELKVMKRNGVILLLMIVAISGTIVLTIKQNRIIIYDTIPMITIAAFTFYKIISAIINLVKAKSHGSPLLSTIRNISLADAAMSILPMQTSMIGSFEENSNINFLLMTIFTGTGICLLFLLSGISMLRHKK